MCQPISEMSYTLLQNYEKGEWKIGKRHGKGTMDYANGGKYTGIWVNDVRTGQGVIWVSGNRYEMKCSEMSCPHLL